MKKTVVQIENITKTYQVGEQSLDVLKNIGLSVEAGEFVAILGPSGSGKSTLMNVLGCLDQPTSGTYSLNGQNVAGLNEAQLAHIRGKEIGFIFQSFQLLTKMSILENVELPLIYGGVPHKERIERARQLLNDVGLGDKLQQKPTQLSGGQQQRVAIARALAAKPALLLADEPTGALDQKTGQQIMSLFKELHANGNTIIMITHDLEVAQQASRIVRILDGNLYEGADSDV